MRYTFLILLLLCARGLAGEPRFDSGLSGRIVITKAARFLDGGSVSIDLRDEHGTEAHVFYLNNWTYPDELHGGQFSFRRLIAAKPTRLRRMGIYERSLLELLRSACVATFGTSDPQVLRAAGGWDRSAMSSLFRQVSSRHMPKSPKQSHRLTRRSSEQRLAARLFCIHSPSSPAPVAELGGVRRLRAS